MTSLQLKYLGLWHILYCRFFLYKLFDKIKENLTLPIIQLVMALMSYIWYTEFISLSVSVRSGDPPSVITAPMFPDISSSTVHELLGTRKLYGYHSCADKRVTCGHVCSSFSVGFLVVNPGIVPLEDNRIIKSWSSFAMKIGAWGDTFLFPS